MGRFQYPRRGERIAPLALREALFAPLPVDLAEATGMRYETLADLDESVWEHASPSLCRGLAMAVARHLQPRLLHLSAAVQERPLPEVTPSTTFADLGVERRTFNCVAPDCDKVCDLAKKRVADLIRRRGMGAISVLDLLCALEAHSSVSRVPVQLQFGDGTAQPKDPNNSSLEGLPTRLDVRISKYPRFGQKLAPGILSPLLNIPLKGRRMFTMRLKDLDASAWERFPTETCLKLADEVVAQIKASSAGSRVGTARLPVPRTGNRPLRIQLEQRTYNCLNDLGLLRDPARLSQMSIADLLAESGFGARCLVDLLSALESLVPGTYQTTLDVVAAARRLVRTRDAKLVPEDDPRFGQELHCLMVQGKNLKKMAEHIVTSPNCPREPQSYAAMLERLRWRLQDARKLTLEEELADLLKFEPRSRNREITLAHLGWAGKAPRTLEEVSTEHGMTRERVRQICHRHLDYLEGKRPYLPVLDRALDAVATELPCSTEQIECILTSQRFTKEKFSLHGILRAIEVTSRQSPFVLESVGKQDCAVPPNMAGVAALVCQSARKSISHWGAATIEDIAAQMKPLTGREVPSEFARSVLSAQAGFRWLDEAAGWFWLESTARNALLNQIEKVLSACGRIHVAELRSGVSRHHRREGFAPPQRVLLQICLHCGWCRVDGNYIQAATPLDYHVVLSNTEAVIVDVLKENLGIQVRQELEDSCTARGIKRDTFYIHLTYSPVIARYAPGVYGVRGAEIPPGLAESMVQTRKKTTRVISDYGWQTDGKVRVSYRLSQGALSNGILSVPGSMKSYVQGEFGLVSPDGQAVGRLVVKDTQAWGLGPFFRRRGGEPGDVLEIVFDAKERVAAVALGESDEDPRD